MEKGLNLKVLDKGFIRVVDWMGDDSSIVQAARVSYGDGTKNLREDRQLIHYLLKNKHTSPFEMCEIKLHCKMPLFVARQWVRHRTASINEYSARYSVLKNEFYIPDTKHIGVQASDNKQGRAGEILSAREAQTVITNCSLVAYDNYQDLLDLGVAREVARMVLPVNIYTEWYWKIDLHNLLHFLKLRLDLHAQFEIRAYAKVIHEIVKGWVPIVAGAFEDYVLGSVTLSHSQQLYLSYRMKSGEGQQLQPKDFSLSNRDGQEVNQFYEELVS